MAQSPQNDSHIQGQKPPGMVESRPPGPVPLRHRMKLGEDVVNNPQDNGRPSTNLKVANNQGKTY